ncbi:hypothetical protein BHM03_00036264 [Ensete ventricosum]|nr:hypothetical protein BHM03_00036264 [Ensete ventricosum]
MLDKNQHQIDVNLPGIVRSSSRNFISSHGSSDHAALSSLTTRSGDSPYFGGTKTNISRAPYLLFVTSPRCQPIAASSSPFSIALSVAALDLTLTMKLHPLTAVASSALVPGHPRRCHLMPRSHCQVLACQPRARDQRFGCQLAISQTCYDHPGLELPEGLNNKQPTDGKVAFIGSDGLDHHSESTPPMEEGKVEFREEAEGELLEEDIKTVDQEDVPLTLEGDANTEGANSVTIDPLTATPVELEDITIH